ncbi:MAG: hypothetical protein K6F63_01895 [Lachnospiraceae bacterium]|nr:hypothetical protein [Lachnospiraceae bacterium]
MDAVKKIIYFAVGIIMTVGFIVMGMTIFNKSKDTIASTNAQYDGLIARYSDIEYSVYDGSGATASGSEVKDLIKRLTDTGVTIYVKNGVYLKNNSTDEDGVAYNCGNGEVCGYGDKNRIDFSVASEYMNDRSRSMFYINSNATFDAQVHRDGNGIIDCLSFVQR